MRIVLVGGTGFIGARLAGQLLAAGHAVAVIHGGRHRVPPRAHSLIADRRDPASLRTALADFRPEALVDLIAYTVGDVEELVPVLPESLGVLTLISSGDVYQSYGAFLDLEPAASFTQSATEDSPLRRSRYPYRAQAATPGDMLHDYDKILVESRYRELSPVPITTVRLPMVYGPGDPQGRVSGDLRRLREAPGGVLQVDPVEARWRCTRGYVEDVAGAIALATVHPAARGQTYNVGEEDAPTVEEWLTAISRASGVPTRVRADGGVRPSGHQDWTVSLVTRTDRIRQELGYVEPIGRTEALNRTTEQEGPGGTG